MAALTLTIPDAMVPRLEEAVAKRNNWNPDIGVTKVQFLKRRLQAYLLQELAGYEVEVAMMAARDTKAEELKTEFDAIPPEV